MTQHEIIELATKAWNETVIDIPNIKIPKQFILLFAKLLIEKECDMCANEFDELAKKSTSVRDLVYLNQTSAIIRARKIND